MNTVPTHSFFHARPVVTQYAIAEHGLLEVLLHMMRDLEDYDRCEKFTAAIIAKAKWMEDHLSLLDDRTQSDFKHLMALEGQTEWRSDVVLAAMRYIKIKTSLMSAKLREQFGDNASEFDFTSPHFDMRQHVTFELCGVLAEICNRS